MTRPHESGLPMLSTSKIWSGDSYEPGYPIHFKFPVTLKGNSPILLNEQPSILLLEFEFTLDQNDRFYLILNF